MKTNFNKETLSVSVTEENTFRMLDYFQQEWKYRHQFFWSILIKLFLLNLFVTMLPFVVEAFGVTVDVSQFPAYIFPAIGALLAIVCYVITQREANRLSAVGEAKYKINMNMDRLYQYKDINNNGEAIGGKNRMANSLPKLILCFQILISVIELIILISS